jgi:hypothetical protein
VADNAEVELDAAGRPGAAKGDLAEFHDVVGVKEIAAGRLVGGTPDLAADLGQDGDRDVGILEPHDGPLLVAADAAELVEEGVGIKPGPVAPYRRAGEDRHGVGIAVGVGFEDLVALGDHGRAGRAAGATAGQKAERGQR